MSRILTWLSDYVELLCAIALAIGVMLVLDAAAGSR